MVPISTAGNDSVLRIYDSTSGSGNKFGFRNDSVLGAFYRTHGGKFVASQNHVHAPLPRMDFPRFDGMNPRAWVLKSTNYFKLMPNVPDAEKINLAIKHFDGKALTWFQSLNLVEVRITWKQFLEVVCARFEVMPVSRIILELNKLKQTENYDEYVERFEELRAYIILNDSSKYSEDYFVASFISGLSKERQAYIDMFQPTNLEQTIELGRKLITLDASSKKLQPPDAEEDMFEAQKANWFGIQEVETNVVQAVEDVLHSVQPMLGNTFSFLHEETTQRLGCVVQGDKSLLVRADNGHKLFNTKKATDFKWYVQGKEFQYSPRFLLIEGYDMILGEDWLSVCSSIEFDYANVVFTVSLNGERVTLKASTTAVDCKGNNGPVVTSLTYEEITDLDNFFAVESDTVHANSTLTLEFFLGRPSDISTPSEKWTETQLGVGDMIFLKFKNLHQYSIFGIGKEFVPVLKSLEDDAAGASMLRARITTRRINAVLQSFIDGIQSGLMFIETASATSIRCKEHIIVQKWPEADDNRDFKIEPLLIMNTHRANRRSQEIPQIPAPWLKLVLQFAIWEDSLHIIQGPSAAGESGALCKKKVKNELYLAVEIGSIVKDLMVEEGPKHEAMQNLPEMDVGGDYKIGHLAAVGLCLFTKKGEHTSEFDSDGHSKIEPLMSLGIRILTRKGEMIAQILIHWLKTRPEFANLEVEESLNRKFPPFDPCGQGSSSGGGIVMAYVGVNGDGDSVKKNGFVLVGTGVGLWMNWYLGRKSQRKKDIGPNEKLGFGEYWTIEKWAI